MRSAFLPLVSLVLAGFGALSSCKSEGAVAPTAPPCAALTLAENEGMHARNVELAERAKRDADAKLVFVGDSITQGWESVPGLWNSEFGRYSPLNLGVSGDRTEHVLWRLAQGSYDHLKPTAIVVMIGTNNTGHRMDPPADIAAGIDAILTELARRYPKARIALLAIFPRGETVDDAMRKNNAEVNALLPAIAKQHGAEWLDLTRAFTDAAGRLPKAVMPDFLHPGDSGYAVWANAMRGSLERWMR